MIVLFSVFVAAKFSANDFYLLTGKMSLYSLYFIGNKVILRVYKTNKLIHT